MKMNFLLANIGNLEVESDKIRHEKFLYKVEMTKCDFSSTFIVKMIKMCSKITTMRPFVANDLFNFFDFAGKFFRNLADNVLM